MPSLCRSFDDGGGTEYFVRAGGGGPDGVSRGRCGSGVRYARRADGVRARSNPRVWAAGRGAKVLTCWSSDPHRSA